MGKKTPDPLRSPATSTSAVDQSGNTASPHHAERDGYVVDAPLSRMRPVFRDILFTSLAAEEAGVELIGMTVQMDLPEVGLTGEAIVTDIQACSEIEPRAGAGDDRRVVTATFHHSSGDVIDLVLADEFSAPTTTDLNPETLTPKPVGEADSIGTTSNHPFWSVDRQEYVQAGQLEIGERLQTLHGDTKTVVSNLPRPGPKTDVYNLEVHAEHVYFVGEDGVLVHNAYSDHMAETISKSGQAKVRVWADGSKRYYKLNKNSRWQKVRDVKAPMRNRETHGNSSNASGPHDLYAMVEPGTSRVLHIGESGRGWEVRTAEHARDALNQRNSFKKATSPLVVEPRPLGTVIGKAAALDRQKRFLQTYERIFGHLPPYNNAGYR